MTGFWIAATLMTVITLGVLMFPAIRRGVADAATRKDFDLTVYKDQLKEVDRDLERGLLSQDQAVSARTEIERRMLGTMEATGEITKTDVGNKSSGGKNPAAVMLMFALLVIVPLGAFGIYLNLGQPSMPDQPLASRAQQLKEATEGR
ncbi:MAG: c-type cytochrome biogenesis protein CcmI, partial [Rhodospirillaceae bacterium]|nr:c-type cytochrome biogenesis protein CcmI [Rhodospirillaceae bacterium]